MNQPNSNPRAAAPPSFRVWAPEVRSAVLVLGGRAVPMAYQYDGWWRCEAAAPHGTDYAFSLDGGPALPDPRSPWQPFGVHSHSRTCDHSLFPWTVHDWKPAPLSSAIIYELHTGTFSREGTFAGIIAQLGRLASLGVTHLELMPVCEFAGSRGWGYDGVDLFAPHHAYGGPDGLKTLIDACHAHGLAVLIDVVYNHLGPSGNYLPRFGPYFSQRHHTPWGPGLNLDGPGSDEVRRFLCDNALMWLRDYRADGLRLDAVDTLADDSEVHFLAQLESEVEMLSADLGRPLVLIAESDRNDPRFVEPRASGGYGLAAQWTDDVHHSLHAALTGESAGYYRGYTRLAHLAKALGKAFVYDGQYAPHRKRRYGRPARGLSGASFVAYLQNHDQTGNRAFGERIGQLAGLDGQMIGSALLLLAPFVPLLFQGEEFGASSPFLYFTDHDEPLGRAIAEGRLRGYGKLPAAAAAAVPDPQELSTFERSRLRWEETETVSGLSMTAWYRGLIALRRLVPALSDGRMESVETAFDEEEQWFLLRRGPVAALCNLSDEPRRIRVSWEHAAVVMASAGGEPLARGHALLAPRSVIVAGDAQDPGVQAWLRATRGPAEFEPQGPPGPTTRAGARRR